MENHEELQNDIDHSEEDEYLVHHEESEEPEESEESSPLESLGGYEMSSLDKQELSIVDQLKSIADPRRRMAERNIKLKWLVDDFEGVTDSVYEAIMVSAARARQVGKRQKLEIEAWNSSRQLDELDSDDNVPSEAGIDHFRHPKPTIQALFELKRRRIRFRYPEAETKQS